MPRGTLDAEPTGRVNGTVLIRVNATGLASADPAGRVEGTLTASGAGDRP